MLTDSERFAFSAWRIHAFGSTGNAYDAVQIDESIAAGDTLLVPDEKVVGVAMTWPFAVTRESGKLHKLSQPGPVRAVPRSTARSVCPQAQLPKPVVWPDFWALPSMMVSRAPCRMQVADGCEDRRFRVRRTGQCCHFRPWYRKTGIAHVQLWNRVANAARLVIRQVRADRD